MQHTIVLPDLGQTTNEARILEWLKRVGEHVQRGEPMLSVETDKVNMDVEAFQSGYLREILVPEGEMATALTPIAILTDTAEEPYHRPGAEPAAPAPGKKIAAVPAARARAKELGIDLASVKGSGANGMVTVADVERAAESRGGSDDRAWSAMAATVTAGKREIPHFYLSADLALDHAALWRKTQNAAGTNGHVTFNDVFVRCAKLALAESPRLRTTYEEGKFRTWDAAEVLVVAAREDGLVFERPAGSGQSKATLAISNLGMFGVKQFAAIIPPGCTAILAIGAVRKDAVVRDGKVVVAEVCTVTLSSDHRVVDGIASARF